MGNCAPQVVRQITKAKGWFQTPHIRAHVCTFKFIFSAQFTEGCLRSTASFDLPESHFSPGRDTTHVQSSLFLSQCPAVLAFQLFPVHLLEIHTNMHFLASLASCPTWKAKNMSLKWLFNKFHKHAKLPKTML